MKRFSWKRFHQSRAGFTLIELMAAMAITGLIGLGASIASAQVMNQTSRDRDYTIASRFSANAIYWIGRDVLMAQTIEGADGFPTAESLTLGWKGWDNTEFSATYTVTDGVLERTYSNGADTVTTMIAQNINTASDMTWCDSVNGTVTLTVTASAGSGARVIDVTKTRVITNRPRL
jgi:prepilin-type N-terminal cleavage/methylation domain-containing protein